MESQGKDQGDLNRFAINTVLHQHYSEMLFEYQHNLGFGGSIKWDYPAMATFESVAKTQARGHPDLLEEYNSKTAELDKEYGAIEQRHWEMKSEEASKRKVLIENLMWDLGPTRIDERNRPQRPKAYDYSYSIDGRDIIYDTFQRRLKENRNLVVLFTGKVGGGKSWASVSTADYLAPSKTVSYDLQGLVFSIQDFISLVQNGKPGDVIILDEAGISASNKDALSKEVKTLGKVIQSIRYLQYCTVFTIPNINFLDKQVRLMVDLVFDHTEDHRQGEFDVKIPQLTEDGKDVEFVSARVNNRIVGSAYFPAPRPSIVKEYEEIRRRNNMAQLQQLRDDISPPKKEDDGRGKNPNSLANLKHAKKGGE